MPALQRDGKKLCTLSEIPVGNARGFNLGEQRYIVVRQAEDIFVYLNRCPHRGVPLEWQPDTFMDPEGEFLRCAAHGALFLSDTGECVAGPCVGEFLIPVAFALEEDALILRN